MKGGREGGRRHTLSIREGAYSQIPEVPVLVASSRSLQAKSARLAKLAVQIYKQEKKERGGGREGRGRREGWRNHLPVV